MHLVFIVSMMPCPWLNILRILVYSIGSLAVDIGSKQSDLPTVTD